MPTALQGELDKVNVDSALAAGAIVDRPDVARSRPRRSAVATTRILGFRQKGNPMLR